MTLQAQQTLTGTVSNDADGKAIPFANMALMRASDTTFLRGTTSDANGHFSLQADTLAMLLRVSVIGYETYMEPVAADGKPLAIRLKAGATTLDEVSIVASKPMYAVDGEKSIYNVSEDPTIQNGTAQDALQNAPGVQVDGDGNITLNGKEVTVYINDRESHYTGEMLKQYIKTLTADQISSIEVMEYPPAKYGGAGPVINIRTEKNNKRNSYLSFGAYGSSKPEVSPFLSYAYANEKLRFDAYVRYSRDHSESNSDGEGTMLNADSTEVRNYSYKSSSKSQDHRVNLSFSLGYDFDTMNTLSAYFSASPSWYNGEGNGRYVRSDLIGTTMEDFSYTSHSDYNRNYNWYYGNISFEHKFNNEGHEIDFSVGGYGGGTIGPGKSVNWQHYDAQPQLNFDEKTWSSYTYGSLSVDANYSLPYSDKGEFGAGLSFEMGPNTDYSRRDTLATDGEYHCDALRSDTSQSPDYGASLYLSWRRKFGNFTLRLGGNLNYNYSADYHLGLPEYDTAVGNFTFGPSVTLMYNTKTMHTFSLNYSTSASLPSASSLSRYVSYGIESYSTGNPDLESSYSHRIGASYNKYFESGHSLGISASFNAEVNKVSYISMPTYSSFFGRHVSFSMPYNAGDSRNGGISAYARLRPSAMLSITLSASVNDDWYRVMLHPGEWMEDEMASWNARLSVRAKLFNLVWVSASGYYNSRSHGWSTFDIREPRWGADLSASADLFERKLSFYVNFYDIFNTANWNSSNINPYASGTRNYTYTSQYISFGVTLRFGKMELGDSSKEGIQSSSNNGGGGK